MIVYELAGLAGVYALHKSMLLLPCRNTLQQHRQALRLEPCIFGVDFGPVYANVQTLFGDVPQRYDTGQRLHTASFDEIAKSAVVDYLAVLDAMGGLCLEHIHELGDAYVGEGVSRIERAAQLVREGKLHIADLISVGAISRLSRTDYGAKPVFIGSSCKGGTWRDVLRAVQTVLEAWARSPDGEVKHGPITSVASDGDGKRRIAFFVLCMQYEVVEGNPLYNVLKHLFGLNLFTGKNNLTMDFDFKHELKRECLFLSS
jgi:hypothetical protein